MDSSLLPASKRPKFAQGMETIMPKSESFKFLCFCLTCPTKTSLVRYRLMAVPISELFRTEQHEAEGLLQQVQMWEYDDTGMGFLPTKDHGLYVVAHGRTPPFEGDFFVAPPGTLNMLKYSMISEDNLLHLIKDKPTSSMPSRCRQIFPIVVEIDRFIYVLSSHYLERPVSHSDEESSGDDDEESTIVFQVYDPVSDTWTTLPPPPFMCHRSPPIQYLVVNNKLCITTTYLSCAFNTKTKIWEACKLFGEGMTYYDDNYGAPFKYFSEGLVIDNQFLVSIIPRSGVVVYKIENNGELSLDFQPLYPGCHKEWLCSGGMFADLGNGCFCVLAVLPFDTFRPKAQIKLFKFKVSVAGDRSHLICDENYVSTVTFKKGLIWEEITSFFAC